MMMMIECVLEMTMMIPIFLFYTTHTQIIIIINVHHILGFRWLVVQFNDAIFFFFFCWLDGFELGENRKTKQKK